MRTHPFLTAMLAAGLITGLSAQTPEPATPAAPEVVIGDAPAASTATRDRDTLSVDFPDEDIRNILRNVADLFELNLVVPDTLQGRTSIKLRDVTWRQIFQVTLTPVGYTYVEEGNIIKVVSQDQLLQEPVSTEVFLINYALAQDILGSVNPLVDPNAGGRVVVNARSNALVITERPSRMGGIRSIIEQLDKATAQVMIESKFIEVTDRDVRDLGLDWSVGASAGAGGDYDRLRSRESGWTRDFDRSRGESIESEFRSDGPNSSTTTNSSSSTTFTPPASGTTIQNPTTIATATSLVDSVTGLATSGTSSAFNALNNLAIGKSNDLRTAVFSSYQFDVVLRALQTSNKVKLVSNPTLVTLNNSEANINIGEEFPIPNYTYNQERGTFEVSGFEYRPIGILLKVTPQVNAQGFIKLTIEPEVSSQSGETTFGGAGGANIPIIATRKTRTQVSLQDGYTMGIGGLIENTIDDRQTRLPILGDIPFLGRLFRSDSKNETSRNLLIFITAKTISPNGAPVEEIYDSRAVRAMDLRRSDLPGYRDGSDPFLPEISE